MSRCRKLLELALRSPAGLRFVDLCRLAECFAFVRQRQSGSHVIYSHPDLDRPLSFQDRRGQAKPYQVRQLLKALRDMERIDE